ncbi:MAG: hypothetical protein ABIN89_11925 [Chitinophagaceae bacterium]
MYKDITLEGKWFLPGKPTESYNGTLTYSEANGCRLKLYDGIPKHFFESGDHPIILGLIKDEETIKQEVTLVDCIYLSPKHTYDVSHISSYVCNLAYLGKHFVSMDKLVFDTTHTSFHEMNNWLDFEAITPVYEGDNISIQFKNLTI